MQQKREDRYSASTVLNIVLVGNFTQSNTKEILNGQEQNVIGSGDF